MTVVAVVVGSASFVSLLTNVSFNTSLNKLLQAFKNLQIILHIMLIDIFCIQHVESFAKFVMKIVNFEIEIIDLQGYMVDNPIIEIKESEPINIHFEASGY